MAWIGPRVAEKSLTEQTNKHTVKQIPRPSLYERMAGNNKIRTRNRPFGYCLFLSVCFHCLAYCTSVYCLIAASCIRLTPSASVAKTRENEKENYRCNNWRRICPRMRIFNIFPIPCCHNGAVDSCAEEEQREDSINDQLLHTSNINANQKYSQWTMQIRSEKLPLANWQWAQLSQRGRAMLRNNEHFAVTRGQSYWCCLFQSRIFSRFLRMHFRRILNIYLVGVCNEFRSPSAYWPATAIRYCADQTPEVVWPRGPGRQVSRSFPSIPCSTSLHIACPKELEAASRSSKTYLAKNGGGRSAPI